MEAWPQNPNLVPSPTNAVMTTGPPLATTPEPGLLSGLIFALDSSGKDVSEGMTLLRESYRVQTPDQQFVTLRRRVFCEAWMYGDCIH